MTIDDAMSPGDAPIPDDVAPPNSEAPTGDAAREARTSSAPKDPFAAAAGMKVVRGTPDESELAALVAGVVAFAGAANDEDDEPGSPTSAWMDRLRTMRGRRIAGPLGRGPSAWRHSLR